MKISEIINEEVSAEEQLSGGLSSNLVPVLIFLKNRSEDKELEPKLRTDSLIQMVKNAGNSTFNYEALVAAHESDDAVKELIKSFNQDEIILKSSLDQSDETYGDDSTEDGGDAEDPTETVASMAKRASSNRG